MKRFSWCLVAMLMMGCGGGESGNADDTEGASTNGAVSSSGATTATEAQTETAVSSAMGAVEVAMTAAFGGLSAEVAKGVAGVGTLPLLTKQVPATVKAMTLQETTTCTPGALPDVVGGDFSGTITGTEIDPDGSGTCAIMFDTDDSTVGMVLDCDQFTLGNAMDDAVIDGKVGFSGLFGGEIATMSYGSENFFITLADGTNCELVLNFGVTLNVSANTISYNGCATFCGSGYTISGTDTF
ncbi:MAG: hypothetical protein HYV02_07965 [Deltaproteobacteria bacterium]|nr:hypothetical protein [Deltaproteobacteria bacterium]